MLKPLIASVILLMTVPASAQTAADVPFHFLRVPVSELTAFTPERAPETEALIRSNLLDDPHSPRIGARQPVLTLVCFTDYSCKECKALDEKLHRILELYPRLALTYKFSPALSQPQNPSRMALTVWEREPEKFDAFHRHLMRYQGVLDDFAVRSAVRAAGGHIYHLSRDASNTMDVNLALMKTLHITDTPTTMIGGRVLWGNVRFEELVSVVNASLKGT